jgi:predicted enzyme related to lactoylglutathione lyase
MSVTIQPVIMTADLDRLQTFYTALLGAVETTRVPEDGTPFFVGLRMGDAELGLVVDAGAADIAGSRILLSIGVADVDALLPRIAELGGRLTGGPTDMPWGQRVAHINDPDGNAVNLTQQI